MTARITLASLAYFAIAFSAGFLFGTVRVLLVTPWTGPVAAVCMETPLMLAVSYCGAKFVVSRFALRRPAERLLTGIGAFLLLMAAELALAAALRGQSPAAFARDLVTTPGVVGLVAQLIFAALPLMLGPPPPP